MDFAINESNKTKDLRFIQRLIDVKFPIYNQLGFSAIHKITEQKDDNFF